MIRRIAPNSLLHILLCALLGTALLSSTPNRAAAQNAKALAKKHFGQGELYYQQGDFKKALFHYKKAQSYVRHPAFIFNIAQCYRQMRKYRKALFFYRLFLSEQPRASNKAEVKRRIKEMEDKVAEAARLSRMKGRVSIISRPPGAAIRVDKFSGPAAAKSPAILVLQAGEHLVQVQMKGYETVHKTITVTAGKISILRFELKARKAARPVAMPLTRPGPGPGPQPGPDSTRKGPRPVYKTWWFWTGIGLSVVSAGLAAGAGVVALKENDKWKESGVQDDRDGALRVALVSDIMWGVAGAFAIATTVAAIVVWKKQKKEKPAAMVTPACGPAGCGIAVHGRF